jgi:hypothetical protein
LRGRPQEHRPVASRAAFPVPKPDDQPPADLSAPRHVVLHPEPANVSISIDGAEAREFGPSFRAVSLAPGSHVFAFKGAYDCCVDEQVTLDIPPGQGSYVVAHRLRFRPAGLYVVSNTPANVHVDQTAVVGRTWSLVQVPQPNMFGNHEVRVSAEGHVDRVIEVRLRAGQIERIEVTLQKKPEAAVPSGSASATP